MGKKSALNHGKTYKFAPGPSVSDNFWENPLQSFANLVNQYGDIVCLDSSSHQIYLINHPNSVKHILQDNYHNYRKDADTFKLIIGDALFVSEGDFWLRQRRMMQPAFHHHNLNDMLQPMINASMKLVERWGAIAESGENINVLQEMNDLTIDISASTMFGINIKDQTHVLAQALTTAQEYLYYQGWDYSEKTESQPTSEQLQFHEAIKIIDKIVYGIIDERRQHAKEHTYKDLLSMLLHASDDETGNQMSQKQLRDEAVAMLAGGQGTTSIALTWIFYVLSTHPEIEIKIYNEIVEVFGQASPTFDKLPDLVYTQMVINEVLRLYPPSWLIARRSIHADEINGYYIPENSEIFISPYLIHRHPDFWDNPEDFDPERFSRQRSLGRSHFSYLPFSAGPHVCIGNHFANMVIQVVLASVLKAYRINLISDKKVEAQPQILLQPEDELLMRLQKRLQSY